MNDDSNQAVILPLIKGVEKEDGEELIYDLTIPPELAYFEGHFDTLPILPGVVQIHWLRHFIKKAWNEDVIFNSINNLKFTHPILPLYEVRLTITKKKSSSYHFVYELKKSDGSFKKCSYGLLKDV